MTLLFNPEQHRYYFKEEPDTILTSVSTLIGMYHEKFDSEKHSKRIAEREGVSQEEILKRWEDKKIKSQIKGTLYHEKKEQEILTKSGVFRHPEQDGLKQAFDITELKPGIYPELIVYHPKYNIVGTADLVIIHNDNTFDLFDHKTSEKLEFTGFPVYNPKSHKKEPKKMFSPIQHIDDCNGQHYALQLSAYSFMLEEAGYICKSLTIHHVLFDEDEQDIMVVNYPINYLKKEVINLFKHYKENATT